MTSGLRKFALTAHVASSVGWLGAVAGFLALAVAGLTSQDDQLARAAYLAMEVTAWSVIVPLSLASPLTGVIQSLGTTWGLFRHHWVLAKFLITVPATLVLLLHMRPIGRLAGASREATPFSAELSGLQTQLVANAGAALFVLIVATVLSVYKPQGRTPYGRRIHREEIRMASGPTYPVTDMRLEPGSTPGRPGWMKASWIIGLVIAMIFLITHLAGGGLGGH